MFSGVADVTTSAKDAYFSYISDKATKIVALSAEPTTYAEASSTYRLGSVDVDSSNFSAPADQSGSRFIQTQGVDPLDITANGTYSWIAVINEDDSDIVSKQPVSPSRAVLIGDDLNVNSIYITLTVTAAS